jgi:hypothetical protein
MTSLFEKLNQGRPPQATSTDPSPPQPAAADITVKPHPQYPPSKRLRDWLVDKWPKATVTTREVRIYGPRPRDGKTVQALMQALTEQRWITPVEARRRNTQEWEIFRRPPAR